MDQLRILGLLGYNIEEIEDSLTQQVKYLDKLFDELAKGKIAVEEAHRDSCSVDAVTDF